MLLALGNVNLSPVFDSLHLIATDQTQNHEWNQEKGKGSWDHPDGWGIAHLSNNEWTITKSTKAIFKDPMIDRFRNLKSSLTIIHVRKMMGSNQAYHNTHPFHISRRDVGEFVFCHNGYIKDEIRHCPSFVPQGKTDSEKLFYSLLTDLQRAECKVSAIRENLKQYEQCTGTNIILSNKTHSIVAIKENRYPKYYTMYLGRTHDATIVSSEILPHLKEMSWEPLEQGDVCVIEHETQVVTIHRKQTVQA